MQTNEYAISVNSLKKSYQKVNVLDDVSFTVEKGSVFSLLGSNGAGKTTTIKILTTLIQPDDGNIEVDGFVIAKDMPHADMQNIRKAISLTGQFASVDESLTGLENLILIGKLNHIANPGETALRLLDYFALSEASRRLAATYSGGMRRKLDIAMSLAGNPSILFLDEPTTGLDPQSRHGMWQIIKDLKQSGVTVFLTTQYLEEAEQLADKIAILHNGSIIAEGTAAKLKQALPHGMLEFTFADGTSFEKALSLSAAYKTVSTPAEKKLVIYTDGTAKTLSALIYQFHSYGIEIDNFLQLLPTLEDVFLTIIEGTDGK